MTKYRFKKSMPPREHQRRGLRFLIEHRGVGALIWSPGAMKTGPVLHYLNMIAQKKGGASVLVVCPLSAVDTWESQALLHLEMGDLELKITYIEGTLAQRVEQMRDLKTPSGMLHLVVMNYDSLSISAKMPAPERSKNTRRELIKAIKALHWDCIVADESHRFKGNASKVGRAMGELATASKRRIIMTGTVQPHSKTDMFSQWRFLQPDRFGTNFNSFKARYAILGGFRGKQIVAWTNEEEFAAKIGQDAMVIEKHDVLDLPPVLEQVHSVTLSPRERRAYDEMASDMVIDMEGTMTPQMARTKLTRWLRLRQLTSGHITETDSKQVVHYGDSKIKYAQDMIRDLIEAGEKVVVFAHFSDEVDRMFKAVQGFLVESYKIDGSTPQAERKRIREAFRDGEDGILVAQQRTISLAVNELVVARHGIYISMSERSDDWQQSKDRLDRPGQTRSVFLHYLVVPDSMDEVVLDSHREKKSLEQAVLAYATRLKDRAS